jgi:hypothetical protein
VPTGPRPTRADIFESVRVNYKLYLNLLAFAVFGSLMALTVKRGGPLPARFRGQPPVAPA